MHRARRFVLLVLLATVFLVALLLTAFGGGATNVPVAFSRTLLATTPQTRPYPEIVAMRGLLRLQLPVSQSRVTAIGYHSAQDGGLSLSPVGHQANEGLLSRVVHGIFGGGGGTPRWYQLGGGGSSVLDVGAPVGTNVYSPVDGTIVSIQPFVVEGKRYGSEIQIAPQTSPSLVVDITQLVASPDLKVGSAVVSGATKLGTVVDLASVEAQALAHYTNDAGNHVTIEVRAAPVLQTD